jgi:uncharacterized protein YjiK
MGRFHGACVATLLASAMTLGCGGGGGPVTPPAPPPDIPLQLVATDSLTIPEPSDVTIDAAATSLWMVTNNPARVYKLDLHGNVVERLNYRGSDLEAIAYDGSDSTLWVVEERTRELVHLDLDGDVLSRQLLDLAGEPNHGPEGLCLDRDGHLFVLNEQNPGLFVALNADLSIASRQELTFAGDYSGLSSSNRQDAFWMVSDQSQRVYLWSKQAGIIGQHNLPFPKAEGVAFNEAANLLYIVSDSEKKLYTYRIE